MFEIVYKYPVIQTEATKACGNYQNKVNLPLPGSHVRIVGVYVQDTFHAQWMEIYPVTSIVVERRVAGWAMRVQRWGKPLLVREQGKKPAIARLIGRQNPPALSRFRSELNERR